MSVVTEGRHAAEFILHEQENNYCREPITIATSQSIVAGQVLGAITAGGDVTVTKTDVGGGKGALTLADPAYGAGVKAGNYKVVIVEPATDAGTFLVEDPDGVVIGHGTVGVAFDGVVKFTLADATDFAAGDTALVHVAIADPAAVGQYAAFDQDATDGTEVASAIAIYEAETGVGETKAIAGLVRGPSVVNGNILTWPSDIDAGEKAAAIAQLAAIGILVR